MLQCEKKWYSDSEMLSILICEHRVLADQVALDADTDFDFYSHVQDAHMLLLAEPSLLKGVLRMV